MGKTKPVRKSLKKTKINSIAAHVPDLVVYSDFKKIPYVEHFNGVLLFADVSGLWPIFASSTNCYLNVSCNTLKCLV